MNAHYMEPRLPDGSLNWEWIKAEFRVGQLSIRNIAKAAGLSDTAVRKRAKRDGWSRDLKSEVRRIVQSRRFASKTVRTSRAREVEPMSDDQKVGHAAQCTKAIIAEHLTSIGQARELVQSLISDLSNCVAERRELQVKDRAIVLEAQSRAVRSLSGALKDLIGLERQALNLDDQEREAERPADYVPLADRVKRYTQRDGDADGKVVPLRDPERDGAI